MIATSHGTRIASSHLTRIATSRHTDSHIIRHVSISARRSTPLTSLSGRVADPSPDEDGVSDRNADTDPFSDQFGDKSAILRDGIHWKLMTFDCATCLPSRPQGFCLKRACISGTICYSFQIVSRLQRRKALMNNAFWCQTLWSVADLSRIRHVCDLSSSMFCTLSTEESSCAICH